MPSETWTSSDQADLSSLLLEAEEAVRTCIRCADQLLDGSSPDETVRAAQAAAAYERGIAVAPTLRSLSAKALRIKKASDAS
ncbi:MAG: hypothetical protein E6Q97_38150 [Desulfurellales bacterium]|nr:MAG: hypothetical protein E6Q97_38150 [Desulfurellales bacterium]